MARYILTSKAQAWGFDLMIAIIIFLTGLIIFYVYVINLSGEADDNLNNVFYEGNLIANNLLSEGSPIDWTSSNVISPGILSQSLINETKLAQVYLLNSDYANLKKIFRINHEFYFYFTEQMVINGDLIDGIGKPGVTRDSINDLELDNLAKVQRITIYKNKPTQLNIYVWK